MMSKIKRLLFCGLLAGSSSLAMFATFFDIGVARADEPQGISLRQESASRAGFFHGYRQHRGGGLHGGK